MDKVQIFMDSPVSDLHRLNQSKRDLLPNTKQGEAFATHIQSLNLYEENHWETLETWIEDNCNTSEAALLASFVYIAGGWTTDVPELVINEIGCRSLKDALDAIDDGELTKKDFECAGEWHDHRKGHYKYVHEIIGEFAEITIDSQPITSFTDAITHLSELDQRFLEETGDEALAREKTFDTALSALSIHRFRSLAAFDWLEILIRVHGFSWLIPPKLKPEYLNTGSKPSQGFALLYDNSNILDADDNVIDNSQTRENLARLERYGRERLGYDDISVVFDTESALCLFASKNQDEIDMLATGERSSVSQDHIC